MALFIPHQSNQAIQSASAGQAARYRGAGEFAAAGGSNLGPGLQQLAQGVGKLGGAIFDVQLQKRKEQMELALLEDVQNFQLESQAWVDEYRQQYRGKEAANAEADASAFYEEKVNALRQRWAGNEQAQLYIQRSAGGVAVAGVDAMRDYGNGQQEAWVDSELEGQRAVQMQLAFDPNVSPFDRQRAADQADRLNLYRYTRRGLDPGRAQAENRAFRYDVAKTRLREDIDARLQQGDFAGARADLAASGRRGAAAYVSNSESRGDPSAVGYDRTGGTSYGAFQIASRPGSMDAFLAYLDKESPEWARRLRASGPANTGGRDGKMPQEWRKIAGEDPERFASLQRDFIEETHVEPVLSAMPEALRKKVNADPGLYLAVFDMAVQHGPAGAKRILAKVLGDGDQDRKETLTSIGEERKKHFSSSSPEVQKAVFERIDRTIYDALGMEELRPSDYMVLDKHIDAAEARAEREVKSIAAEADNAFALYRESGDSSYLDELGQRLEHIGRTDAITAFREQRALEAEIQPYYQGLVGENFDQQRADIEAWFGKNIGRHNAAMMSKVKDATLRQIDANQKRFLQDQAGYIAAREYALGDRGAPGASQRRSVETQARENMRMQEELGAGIPGFTAKVLSAAQATEVKGKITSVDVPAAEKLDLLASMHVAYGALSHKVFEQLDLPPGVLAAVNIAINDSDRTIFARDLLEVSLLSDENIKAASVMTPDEARKLAMENSDVQYAMQAFLMAPGQESAKHMQGMSEAVSRMARIGKKEALEGLTQPYHYILDEDRHNIRISKIQGLDPDRVEYGLGAILEKVETLLPKGTSKEEAQRIKQAGRWQSTDDGHAVLVYDGRQVPGQGGLPIAVSFTQAASIRDPSQRWRETRAYAPSVDPAADARRRAAVAGNQSWRAKK
ncbi:hypothetical protein LJC59_01325 [Desulfovibrio sp. OttesenSCG-928-A18]|nr:hypothetical protein [Desulfovibrio sp. OttesenSCG-928-A18]